MRFSLAVVLLSCFILDGCKKESKEEALTKKVCSSCHAFTEPSMLDKKTWETSVLPEMRFRMGFHSERLWDFSKEELKVITPTLPKRPLVTEEEWNAIKRFILDHAPDSLETSGEKKIQFDSLKLFTPATYPVDTEHSQFLTFIRYDSTTNNIFAGTRHSKVLQLSSDDFQVQDSLVADSAPSKMIIGSDGAPTYLLTMGIMEQNDKRRGRLHMMNFQRKELTSLVDSLKRPVDVVEADLNNDGEKDLLIACFGNVTGELLAFEKKGKEYVPHVIHNFPGTRRILLRDVNKDGYQDIVCLVTQADERIIAFINRGEFMFYQRQFLRFPPVYGSSFFDLVDMDGDGHQDILYTNGDNADYSAIVKPYHGVHVFHNDGDNNFGKSWSFNIAGASKAVANDFDNDGDNDIAVICFFPDFENSPERGFVYFKNTSHGYIPQTTEYAGLGRWIDMDVGDFDRDGDSDIVLAALNFEPLVPKSLLEKWAKSKISILVLKNRLNEKSPPLD